MKKYLILFGALFFSLAAFAQLEVKEGSFKEDPRLINFNSDRNYRTDDNDLPFAIIKVRTDNINEEEKRKLRFEGNPGTCIVLEYLTGEVWVYITAKYAHYLKIKHPDYGETIFEFPCELKPYHGYELVLNQKETSHSQDNGVDKSYYVTIYDCDENMIATGLLIEHNGKVYIRVSDKQYELKESDKKSFSFMTISDTKKELFYVR